MSEVTTALTDEQIAFFEEQGYLAVDTPLMPADELAWLREAYDRIFQERAGREEGNEFDLAGTDEEGKQATLPQILNPAKYVPDLLDTQLLANLKHIARQLRGEEADAKFAHAIFKPAHRLGDPVAPGCLVLEPEPHLAQHQRLGAAPGSHDRQRLHALRPAKPKPRRDQTSEHRRRSARAWQ